MDIEALKELARKRVALFDEWKRNLDEGNSDRATELFHEIEAVEGEVEKLIGFKPAGTEYENIVSGQSYLV